MSSETNVQQEKIGVIGAGSFGTAISNLLAENHEVLIYTRREEALKSINVDRFNRNQAVHQNVTAIGEIEQLCQECTLILPLISSKTFRESMRNFAPYLSPRHILIHGTKGLDLKLPPDWKEGDELSRNWVKTMSEVIIEETLVVRVGCLAGPNLAGELAKGLPAGTVVASRFDEVIQAGKDALSSHRFRVYENHDLEGVELAGVLKNILAIGSGMISGLEFGENARALLITRGWGELMRVAEVFGSDRHAFLGLSGIGDLIATCSSPMSRNYTVGFRLAKGETLEEIIDSMEEIAEGVNTIRIAYGIVKKYKLHAPIIQMFFTILYKKFPIAKAIDQLMLYPYTKDVDFRVTV